MHFKNCQMKTRRTARTIVVWIALLLIASWLYTYFHPVVDYIPGMVLGGYNWERLYLIDATIIALAAGFLLSA
jgi:xanthine/uracil permease